jgi:hypothetical protein
VKFDEGGHGGRVEMLPKRLLMILDEGMIFDACDRRIAFRHSAGKGLGIIYAVLLLDM